MRISDWNSDVCSSDLLAPAEALGHDEAGCREVEGLGGTLLSQSAQASGDQGHHPGRVADVMQPVAVQRDRAGQVRLHRQGRQHRVEKVRSEEHTSELQSLMRISYAVFCLKKKKNNNRTTNRHKST